MLGLMMYTFVTMVGGNPDHDAYGFRYWKNPVISPHGPFCALIFFCSNINVGILFPGLLCGASSPRRYWEILGSIVMYDSGLVYVGFNPSTSNHVLPKTNTT